MKRIGLAALLVASCAAPRVSLPDGATVFVAPCERPLHGESELSDLLIGGFERTLRSWIKGVPAAALEDADFVVQPVLSFARLDLRESQFKGDTLYLRWDETVAGTIIVTHRKQPGRPVVIPVRSSTDGVEAIGFLISIDVLMDQLRGCRIDVATGAITTSEGRPAWIPNVATPKGWDWDAWRETRRALGLPEQDVLAALQARLDHDTEDLPESHFDWRVWKRMMNALSFAEDINNSGPENVCFTWARFRPVLEALEARGRLRDRQLDVEQRELLGSLCERIAYEYGEDGPEGDHWTSPEHVQLYRWLVARLRDDFDEFRRGYESLLAKDIEPEFCRVIYERWPPEPQAFRNAFAQQTPSTVSTSVSVRELGWPFTYK